MEQDARLQTGISRRSFIGSTGAVVGSLALGASLADLLAACGGSSPASTNAGTKLKPTSNVVYAGYGGFYEQNMKQAVLTPFQQATSVQVGVTTAPSDPTAKVQAMERTKQIEWDVVDATGPVYAALLGAGLLEKADFSIVDASDLQVKEYQRPYGAAMFLYSKNIYWNTKLVKGPLNSWADVWDVKAFPGKRGFVNVPFYTLEKALLADGVPMSKLYPLDVDRAFKSLDKIKPNAVFTTNINLGNLIAQGAIVTGDLNLARTQQMIKDGVPLTYNWQECLVDVEYFPIVKGAPNLYNANKLNDFTLKPEQQLNILKLFNYAPVSKKAISQLDKQTQANIPGTDATLPTSFFLNTDWWAKNLASVNQRFQQWLLG
jgi:putative spermidine/putrescine transport system substrate-binding protein